MRKELYLILLSSFLIGTFSEVGLSSNDSMKSSRKEQGILGGSHPMLEKNEDLCLQNTDCGSCQNAAAYCHWCPDSGSCHSARKWREYKCGLKAICNNEPDSSPFVSQESEIHDTASAPLVFHGDNQTVTMTPASPNDVGVDTCKRTEPEYAGTSQTSSTILGYLLSGFSFISVFLFFHNRKKSNTYKPVEIELVETENFPQSKRKVFEDGESDINDPEIDSESDSSDSYESDVGKDLEMSPSNMKNIESKGSLNHAGMSVIPTTIISFLVASAMFTTFTLYPKQPSYNVCSTRVAWRSIIQNLVQIKGLSETSASFEVLMSIYNPNAFDLNVTLGSGSIVFGESEDILGTFNVESKLVKAQSIIDETVKVDFYPFHVKPLKLLASLKAGDLYFKVDANLHGTFPQLGGLSIKKEGIQTIIDFKKVEEHVKGVLEHGKDRSLCKCDF